MHRDFCKYYKPWFATVKKKTTQCYTCEALVIGFIDDWLQFFASCCLKKIDNGWHNQAKKFDIPVICAVSLSLFLLTLLVPIVIPLNNN